MMFIVRQVALKADGSEIVRQTEVAGEELFIGRNASNGVHLPDLAVNPVHARVERRGGDRGAEAKLQAVIKAWKVLKKAGHA